MKLQEAKEHVGKLVMSYDFGHKLHKTLEPHGPYKLLKVTKEGLCILEGREQFRIRPADLISYATSL